ncbi:MAG: S-methyl-5-thioribose-1-phosphate isomerase [Bacteroidota bacterium]
MNIQGKSYQTIWVSPDNDQVIQIIDQRHLPHKLVIENLATSRQVMVAIRDMHLRGAPLIGVAAAYGMYLACLEAPNNFLFNDYIQKAALALKASRPTAVDLRWAVDLQVDIITKVKTSDLKIKAALEQAHSIKQASIDSCRKIGKHGLSIIEEIAAQKSGEPVYILTHCNAGWLACVDYGTATAPIYLAHDKGIPVHIWVDETRPRNQGARLTAFELLQHGIPHTVITDNVGGHLMQHGMVDMVLVGTDRTTRTGDVANKIGTYLKALAAKDNHVPFYVGLPSSTIDWSIRNGLVEIPIEERSADEVKYISGFHQKEMKKVLLTPKKSPAINYAFDVTPAHLVTGLITERGICEANEKSMLQLFPEQQSHA